MSTADRSTAGWVRRPTDCYRILTVPVSRARGWRLYTRSGERILDLTGGEGAALLGHRIAGVRRRISEALDRGTTLPLPGPWPQRLARLLEATLATSVQTLTAPCNMLLPLATDDGASAVAIDGAGSVAFRAPLPSGEAPVLQFQPADPPSRERLVELATDLGADSCAAMAAALVALQLVVSEPRERIAVAQTFRIPKRWRRHGVYLWSEQPRGDGATWDAFRRYALERGLLLPRFGMPIVLPGDVGKHEQRHWEELVHDWPE